MGGLVEQGVGKYETGQVAEARSWTAGLANKFKISLVNDEEP